MGLQIVEADSPERIAFARALINEYIASLGVDLSFQDVSRELAELEQRYAPPRGCLLLALNEAHPVGCVVVHPLDARIASEPRCDSPTRSRATAMTCRRSC